MICRAVLQLAVGIGERGLRKLRTPARTGGRSPRVVLPRRDLLIKDLDTAAASAERPIPRFSTRMHLTDARPRG